MTTEGAVGSARVLIAEDDAVLMYTLRLIVEQQFEVVGEAPDGQAAVEMTEQLRPDVVLLDISMPRLGGIEAARQIRGSFPDVRVLIVSSYTSPAYVDEALSRGVHGYVFKGSAMLQLPKAIEEVLSGGIFRPAAL